MTKKDLIIAILAVFLLTASLNIAYAQTGCCLNAGKPIFCIQSSSEECCGNDLACLNTKFVKDRDCAGTGQCYYVADSCCRDSCTAAKKYPTAAAASPLLCSDASSFELSACSAFSECKSGCFFCSGSARAVAYNTLQYGVNYCAGIKQNLSYFDNTTPELECPSKIIPPAVDYFALNGTVRDSSGTAVSSSRVQIAGMTALTDGSGFYSFPKLLAGSYTIIAYKEGFFESMVLLPVNSNLTRDFTLQPAPASSLVVNVRDFSGSPVSSADVAAGSITAQTDAGGTAAFSGLVVYLPNHALKPYKITASKSGASAWTMATLSESVPVTVNLSIITAEQNFANVSGYISGKDESGNNVNLSNVAVQIGGKSATTDDYGRYEIKDISVGQQQVAITPPTPYLFFTQIVTINPGENSLDFFVQRSTAENVVLVNVAVTSAEGPVSGASVLIKKTGDVFATFSGTTSDSGEVSAIVQRASYDITVVKSGFMPWTESRNLFENTSITAVLTKTLLGIYRVEGTIINATSQEGMPGATVYLGQSRWTMTDSSGNYLFYLVPEGDYILSAEKAGYVKASALISVSSDTEKNLTLGYVGCTVGAGGPVIENLSMDKSSVVINFRPTCEASGIFIYRCEGEVCTPVPITNILPSTMTRYVDTSVKPNTIYWYEVHSMHEKPYAQEKVSEAVSIYTGMERCFFSEGEFCLGNKRSQCNESNFIITIAEPGPDDLCMPVNSTKTAYVSRQNCSLECNKPLGMFSLVGELQLSMAGGAVYAPCNNTDFIKYPALGSCYRDFETTSVDRYFSCENVTSCYDYRSQGACAANRCAKQMSCEWRGYLKDLSLGVCVPREQKYQNCSRCDALSKYNSLFGYCDKEMCDLYGGNESYHYCYYESRSCKNRNVLNCQHYGKSQQECTGETDISVRVDVGGTNRILRNSTDLLSFGLCRYNTTSLPDRCIKDADDDFVADKNPDDMTPPETIIPHPTATRAIDFPVYVYDDENKTYPVGTAVTFYSIGRTFSYPSRISEDGRIRALDILDGLWNVYFFSKDAADNLEVVKSFPVLVDKTKPVVDFNYSYSENHLTVNLLSSEILRCTGQLNSETGENVQPENNLAEAINSNFVIDYSAGDGVYYYPYKCLDWVGNEISGIGLVVVDTEGFFYNMNPDAVTVSKSGSFEISMSTKAAATCRYFDADTNGDGIFEYNDMSSISYNTMNSSFTSTDGINHFAVVNDIGGSIAKKYFVRCVISASGELTKSNISAIRFTTDTVAPRTDLYEAWDVTNPPVFNASVWRKQASLTLRCVDPQSPAVLPTADYAPREFGCRQLNYCTSLESYCEPKAAFANATGGNETGKNATPLTEISIYSNSTVNVCYYSEDKGNNTENGPKCMLIPIDKFSPSIKITSITTTPDGRTRDAYVNVTGVVNNVAYWADSAESIPDYFGNFTFLTAVSSESYAELRFDWKSKELYDYMTLDFANDKISYGRRGEVPRILTPAGLSPGRPAEIKVEVDPSNLSLVSIYLNNTLIDTFLRSATEGRIVFSNNTFTDILIYDNSVTSPLRDENVTVIIRGNETQQLPIVNGAFSGTVDLSPLLSLATTSGLVEFMVRDYAGNAGYDRRFIVIDRFGPATPPLIDPPMDSKVNSYGDNYMKLGYPLYYENEIYYFGGVSTNGTVTGYISGNTSEKGVMLELRADDQSIMTYAEPNMTDYKILSGFKLLTATSTSPAGSTEIRATEGAYDVINQISGQKYVSFKSHFRKSYLAYKKAYPISSVNITANETRIYLAEPLEKKVSQFENFSILNSPITSDRFEFAVPLPATAYNETYLQIWQYDDLGNPGAPTDRLHVIIDAVPPVITFASPHPSEYPGALQAGMIVLQNLSGITIGVFENGTGLRENSFNLTINSQRKDVDFAIMSQIERQTQYIMNYSPSSPLPDGVYNITFNVRDKANNKAELSNWYILIDSTLPHQPSFFITNGVNVSLAPDGYAFVNGVPTLKVSYPDNNTVNIVSAVLYNMSSPIDFVTVDCQRDTASMFSNIFNCALNITPGYTLPEGDYLIEFVSLKIYSDMTTSGNIMHPYKFSYDITPPNVTAFNILTQYLNTKNDLEFNIFVSNEDSHWLKINVSMAGKVLGSASQKLFDNQVTGKITAGVLLTANLKDGMTYPVNLIVADYGGNVNSLMYDNFTVDNTAPIFYPDEINISAQPIYSYIVPEIGGKVYIVRADWINISGNVPNDTIEISFVRLTGETPQPIAKIVQCSKSLTKYCVDETGYFFVRSNSTVVGEIGKVTPNLIQIIAKDRAGNTFDITKFIYKDIEKPTVIVCTLTECTQEIVETSPVITDPQEMIRACGQRVDCYDILITAVCKMPETLTTNFTCYKSYVAQKIALPELYPLCDRIVLYRDSCLNELAYNTGAKGLCEKISNTDLKKICYGT